MGVTHKTTLYINSEDGQVYQWWMNFLLQSELDLDKELAKYNASVRLNEDSIWDDAIEFDTEQDKFWFLLKWS